MAIMKSFILHVVLSAGVLLAGAGCSGEPETDEEPRLDLEGTQGDFDRSQELVRDSLTEQRREIFDAAMRTLYARASTLRDEGTLSSSETQDYVMQQMHERTAEQIVDEALRTYREFCTDNQLSDQQCSDSIEAAGLNDW